MINLYVLDGPNYANSEQWRRYRGIERFPPLHRDELPEDHEANKLFFWFLTVSVELGAIHEECHLPKLKRLVDLYNMLSPSDPLEIIEVTGDTSQAKIGFKRLGFDLSTDSTGKGDFSGSLIAKWGDKAVQNRYADSNEKVHQIHRRIFSKYRPFLNDNLLFDSSITARDCLEEMNKMSVTDPQWFNSASFEVVSISSVYSPREG